MKAALAPMPHPADRVARRAGVLVERASALSTNVTVIRAFAHLRTPEQTHAPADRIARRR